MSSNVFLFFFFNLPISHRPQTYRGTITILLLYYYYYYGIKLLTRQIKTLRLPRKPTKVIFFPVFLPFGISISTGVTHIVT